MESTLATTEAEKEHVEDVASTLHASNINVTPIDIKGSGKEKTTTTAKRVDVFRVSSSASIEVLMGFALSSLFGLDIEKKDIALLAKDAENHFIGVNCGIMDQFAVAMGKKDHAILLNCDNLGYEYIPFKTANYSLLIINTNKQRSLAEQRSQLGMTSK